MRRSLLALAVLPALLLLPGTPAGSRPPENVRAWLGSWETNFGTLFFYDVFREDGGWKIRGVWTRDDDDRKRIDAGLIARDRYRTVDGCWLPPPEPETCGRIFVYRRDEKIRGGYWKTCRLNCNPHHPFKGEKKEGAWKVGFQFTQRGRPDGERNLFTQSGGAGSLVFRHDPRDTRVNPAATRGSRMFQVEGSRGPRMTVRLNDPQWREGERRTTISLAGQVTSRNAICDRGDNIGLLLQEGKGGVPDAIVLVYKQCDRQTRRYVSLDKNRVDVRISSPSETR